MHFKACFKGIYHVKYQFNINKLIKSIGYILSNFVIILGFLCLCTGCLSSKAPKKISSLPEQAQIYDSTLPPFSADTIDGILVKVGNESILLSDLKQTVDMYPNIAANDALNSLIDEKVIEIKADSLGIVINDEELSKSITDFLQSQNFSEADLAQELERNGKSMQEYREVFRKEMVKQQLIGRAISPFITVSNDEVSRFYLQQTKNVKQVEKVKLRSLLIEIPEDYTGDVLAYDMVQKVDNEIKNKADFVDLVRRYSGAKTAKDDLGILSPKNPKELPEELQNKLAELEVNEAIGPFSFGRSVFFFQYLGVDLTEDSDLFTNFDDWKNKLMNQKFSEHLAEYLRKERSALKIITRPYEFPQKN